MPTKPQPRPEREPRYSKKSRESGDPLLDSLLDPELGDDSQEEEGPPQSRVLERISLGGYLGAFGVLIVALLSAALPLCSSRFTWGMWGWAVGFAVFAVAPGGAAGAIGATVETSLRAAIYGGLIFVCGAFECLWLGDYLGRTLYPRLWVVLAATAYGALTGGFGAWWGRTIPWEGDGGEPLRMSWGEMLATSALLAVLVGAMMQALRG